LTLEQALQLIAARAEKIGAGGGRPKRAAKKGAKKAANDDATPGRSETAAKAPKAPKKKAAAKAKKAVAKKATTKKSAA
jgi:DNA topoisomerase-1